MSDKKKLYEKRSLLERLIKKEGRAGNLPNFTEYVGLKGPPNKRVIGSSEYGSYYDPVGKLTGGIGHLITNEDEAAEILNQSKEQAEETFKKDTKKAERYINPLLEEHGIDPSLIGDTQKEGLLGALFQLGKGNFKEKSGLTGFRETFKALKEEDYKKMADEAKDSKWYKKQSPDRVEDFIKLMSVGKERDDLREDVKRLGGFTKSKRVESEPDDSGDFVDALTKPYHKDGGIVKKYADGGKVDSLKQTIKDLADTLGIEDEDSKASDVSRMATKSELDDLSKLKDIQKENPFHTYGTSSQELKRRNLDELTELVGGDRRSAERPFSKKLQEEMMPASTKARPEYHSFIENPESKRFQTPEQLKQTQMPTRASVRNIQTKKAAESAEDFMRPLGTVVDDAAEATSKIKRPLGALAEEATEKASDFIRPRGVMKKLPGLAGVLAGGVAGLASGDANAAMGDILGVDAVGEGSDKIPGRPMHDVEIEKALEGRPELLEKFRRARALESMTPEMKDKIKELEKIPSNQLYAKGGVVHAEDGEVFNKYENPFLRDLTQGENLFQEGDEGYEDYGKQETPSDDSESVAAREQALINEIAGEEKKVEKVAEGDQERKPSSDAKPELDLQSEYKSLLEQLKKPKSTEKSDELKKAEWLDAISSIAGSLDRYGVNPRTPGRQTQFAKQVASREAKTTGMDALKSRAGILKQLQDLKKGSKSGFSNDPKSVESINMADKLKKLYGVDYGGMSEAAMVKAFPGLVSTDRAKFLEKGKESRHKQRFEFKANETEAKRMEKIVSDFNSDPIMRDSKKAIIAADKAETIIKKGGKLAPAVMGRLLARMAGEVGVMTDQDVAAFKGSPQWTDSLQRWFKRGISGKLTKTDKQEMLKMVNNLRTVERSAIAGYADTLAKQYSNASGLSRKRIMSSILPKESSELFEVSDKVKIQAPNGETRLVDKKSVQKYLDKGGKIIED